MFSRRRRRRPLESLRAAAARSLRSNGEKEMTVEEEEVTGEMDSSSARCFPRHVPQVPYRVLCRILA